MQFERNMHFMSFIVHPITSLYSQSTLINFSSFKRLTLLDIIIERVLAAPWYAYLRRLSGGFNSNLEAYKIEGRSLVGKTCA